MAARWWTLKEIVDLNLPDFAVGESGTGLNTSTYEWEARHVAGSAPDFRQLVVFFGSQPERFVGAQVRLRQIGAAANAGDYDLYSMFISAIAENSDPYQLAVTTSNGWFPPVGWTSGTPIPFDPNPSEVLDLIPEGTARIVVSTASSADYTNGYVYVQALMSLEFFIDLGTSDFWTDLIGTSPG